MRIRRHRRDLLTFTDEHIIDVTASLDRTVRRVMREMDGRSGPAGQHSPAADRHLRTDDVTSPARG